DSWAWALAIPLWLWPPKAQFHLRVFHHVCAKSPWWAYFQLVIMSLIQRLPLCMSRMRHGCFVTVAPVGSVYVFRICKTHPRSVVSSLMLCLMVYKRPTGPKAIPLGLLLSKLKNA